MGQKIPTRRLVAVALLALLVGLWVPGCKSKAMLDCERSCGCRAMGLCTDRNGACVAEGDACKNTQICRLVGRCTAKDGACVVGGDEDCKAANWCTKRGFCTARLKEGHVECAP